MAVYSYIRTCRGLGCIDETNLSAVTLFLPLSLPLLILSPSFSHGFPLRGEGAEKGEVLLSDLSV